MDRPLADRIRPDDLSLVVGQQHLLGEGKILANILNSGNIPNMIFYGPSGVGKTTVANIAAKKSNRRLYKLNATNASVSDIKDIIKDLDGMFSMGGVLLYLDEIQNFNKKQQQSLLEFIENGKITLIASTTENPYFYVYNAILSRCTVFEFRQVEPSDIEKAVRNAISVLQKDVPASFSDEAIVHIANACNGDVRKAINAVEIAALAATPDGDGKILVTLDAAVAATQKKALRYDRDGDSHYDVLSAFQKSVRGSDPDAALHYLARLIAAGDLISICRRLLVMAAEDIGLAYPQAITIVKSCVDAANQLGFPEARIPLAEAVILLATAPKSNSANVASAAALADVNSIDTGDVPDHLKDSHYKGAKKMGRGLTYQFPHDFPGHYVPSSICPTPLKIKNIMNTAKTRWSRRLKRIGIW